MNELKLINRDKSHVKTAAESKRSTKDWKIVSIQPTSERAQTQSKDKHPSVKIVSPNSNLKNTNLLLSTVSQK